MRRFVVSIERENAAFCEGTGSRHIEVARILKDVAKRVEVQRKENGYINDVNGNRVGYFDMNA